MPVFSYLARDGEGKVVTGTLTAESEKVAAGQLRHMGLLPQRISAMSDAGAQVTSGGVLERVFLGPPLAAQLFVFQQLDTMVTAGMPLSRALERLLSASRTGRLRRALVEAHRDVESGGRLSDALARFPWLFSGLQLSVIKAGETSGGLDTAFRRLADYIQKDLQFRRKFSRATLYPKLLLLAAVLMPGLPVFVLNGWEAYWGMLSHTLIPALGVLAGLWILCRCALQIRPVAVVWDTFKLSLPGIGGMVRKLGLAKFCRALAALYSAGVPIASAVELAAGASGNKSMESNLVKAAEPLRQGMDLHSALVKTEALTGMVEDMVATGQITGGIDAMMNKVADFYEAEAEAFMDKMVIFAGVLAFLAVALFVGYTVLRMYGAYSQDYADMLGD